MITKLQEAIYIISEALYLLATIHLDLGKLKIYKVYLYILIITSKVS
jgi:hypothetical protein